MSFSRTLLCMSIFLLSLASLKAQPASSLKKSTVGGSSAEISDLLKKNYELSAQVADLKKRTTNLEDQMSLLLSMLQGKQDKNEEVILDPSSLNTYQRIDAGSFQLLVSLESVTPFLNGYKVVIDVGNPSTVKLSNVKVTCKWAKRFDWNNNSPDAFKRWHDSIRSTEVSVQKTVVSGSWNPVEIVVLPASPEELGYLAISITTGTASLSAY